MHTYARERTSPAYVRAHEQCPCYRCTFTRTPTHYFYVSVLPSSRLLIHWMLTPIYIYTLSSRSCTPQTRSCPSRLTAIIANRRYRCTSSGTVRKSSSRVKPSRFQAQGRTLRLFGTDLVRDAIIRRHYPRVILLSYPLYHKHHSYFVEGERRQIDISRGIPLNGFETETSV